MGGAQPRRVKLGQARQLPRADRAAVAGGKFSACIPVMVAALVLMGQDRPEAGRSQSGRLRYTWEVKIQVDHGKWF